MPAPRTSRRPLASRASVLALAVLLLAAAQLATPPSTAAETFVVQMTSVDFQPQFVPAELSIRPGDTVRWINVDPAFIDHSTCSGTGSTDPAMGQLWNSGPLAFQATFEHTFDDNGTFEYFSVLHEFESMFGVVNVGDGSTDVPGGIGESTWTLMKARFRDILPRD